ncbi:MAG TPA: hypothetical protein VK694_04210 [Verrucomicrobiae bacterium]|nr:hypothetical protein [Verrucomicrobiae bacterium]
MPRVSDGREGVQVPAEEIAGIPLVHISDESPRSYAGDVQGDLAQLLVDRLARADSASSLPDYSEPLLDRRVARLVLQDTLGKTPAFDFVVTPSLARQVAVARRAKGSELSQDELLRLGLEGKEGAVESDFLPDALNALNASYYGAEPAFANVETQRGQFFTSNVPFNLALGALFSEQHRGHKVRIKELGSGGDVGHWHFPAWAAHNSGIEKLDIVLTDFVEPRLDSVPAVDYATFSSERYSLFDDLQKLPSKEKFDVLFAAYVFDSVWFPEDVNLSRIGDEWYQTLYRVRVANSQGERQALLEALRAGRPLPDASVEDYDGIEVERAMRPFDVAEHPFGRYIAEYDRKSVNVPGGLIKTVVSAFKTQIASGGIFVVGDTGDFMADQQTALYDSGKSGVAARYKMNSYRIAKTILEQEFGLEVTLLSVEQLVAHYLTPNLRRTAFSYENYVRDINELAQTGSNGVMIVRQP